MNRHFLAALAAFVIWGFFSLAIKALSSFPSSDILFFRVFIAALFMGTIILTARSDSARQNLKLFRALPSTEKQKTIFLTILGGLLLTANWFFFIYVTNTISIKTASYAYLVCPILTVLLAFFILKEKINAFQWLAVVISLVSCVILALENKTQVMYSLIVAFTYAFYLISQKKNQHLDKFISLGLQMFVSALLILPFFPFLGSDVPKTPFFFGILVIIAVVFTIIPLFLNLYALKGISSATMGIILYINPLLNFVFATAYFKEPFTQNQILSYTLIAVAIMVFHFKFKVNLKTRKKILVGN